jgi:hypothetical protein
MKSERLKEISDRMFKVGNDFMDAVDNAKSLREKKVAFNLAKEAFALVIKSEPKPVTDGTLMFLEGINANLLRSDLWAMYLNWCTIQDVQPVQKAKFFDTMKGAGFRVKRIDKGFIAIPPPQRG